MVLKSMTHFWKISTAILLMICAILLYKYYYKEIKNSNNSLSLSDIDKENFDYKKKKDPIFSKDLNDYFFKNPTSVHFLENLYDFDTIPEGKSVFHNIKYVNTGKNPYFITDIKVTCGCTIPSYDKEPVKSGDTGVVKVQFNSDKKSGYNMNKLSIFGNTEPSEKSVYFQVYVTPK